MRKFLLALMCMSMMSCAAARVQPTNTIKGKFVDIVYEITDFRFINVKSHEKAELRAAILCSPNVPKLVLAKTIHRPLAWKMDGQIAFISHIPYMFLQYDCVRPKGKKK